jgi:hypothetical protein
MNEMLEGVSDGRAGGSAREFLVRHEERRGRSHPRAGASFIAGWNARSGAA